MGAFWIAEIQISDRMEAKLREKHNLTGDELRSCLIPERYDRAGWENHPEHGRRLLIESSDEQGRPLKVILQPVDILDGTWRLRTAWRMI